MDFFSAVQDANPAPSPTDDVNSFAEAIASRFGSTSILTARLVPQHPLHPNTPPPPTLPLPSFPMANMTLASPTSPSKQLMFTPVTPSILSHWINDPNTLVVDIRPHAAHSFARIPRALSLSVPSTLLKRPRFSLERLAEMLPSASARNRFSAWHSAARIIVYDADSSSITESSNIHGLLRKFRNDAFEGELAWLQGGFQAVWRERKDLVDKNPPTPETEPDDDEDLDQPSSLATRQNQPAVLRTKHLPMSAFSLSSTTASRPTQPPKRSTPLSLSGRSQPPPSMPISMPSLPESRPAFNPFFDAIRQNTELLHGITERIPLRLPRRVRRRINELPFRWLQDIARRAANSPHHTASQSDSESEDDDDGADPADVEEGTEALAMQFYRIELAEQRRLMGVMEHHSKESGSLVADGLTAASLTFPFSITAGVEKGAKNRYRHIWPFEHARVRLHQKRDADDDYVNASYVQPIGTKKRYIATQGPLPATFTDFWTLCWEQNVHVIVMLTREVEGATVKCGSYWTESTFGPLRLRLVSTTGESPKHEQPALGFFAPPREPDALGKSRAVHKPETIKRVFELSHTEYPAAGVRKVVQLQYLEWPDMNVPDDPRGVLGLIRDVEAAVVETRAGEALTGGNGGDSGMGGDGEAEVDERTGIARRALGSNSPVLLHCSAGVGRTGGFIAVDAVLDAVRREVRKQAEVKVESRSEDVAPMDVDATVAPSLAGTGLVVPIPVTAGESSAVIHSKAGEGQRESLVVHVPFVGWNSDAGAPVPTIDGMKTPMQVDSEGAESSEWERERESFPASTAVAVAATTSTRRWAEAVLDETGARPDPAPQGANATLQLPLPPSSSSTSASGSSSSEDSYGFNHDQHRHHHQKPRHHAYDSGPSSSLGTSVSGSSSLKLFPPVAQQHSLPNPATQANPGADHQQKAATAPAPFNLLPPFTFGLAEGDQRDRVRTFSAPSGHVAAPKSSVDGVAPSSLSLGLGPPRLGGIGSSPLASSSTPWLTEDRKFNSPSPFARPGQSPSVAVRNLLSLSSEGEAPSRSMSPSVGSNSNSVSISALKSKSTYSPLDSASPPASSRYTPDNLVNSSFRATNVDYKEPRPLHGMVSPPVLSTLEDPIWEVVQDMREQRMSLCQSLRQYVFVHAAVIEGALMIVDEERERGGLVGEKGRGQRVVRPAGAIPAKLGSPVRPVVHVHTSDSSTSSTGKRGASPTELLKEDRAGGALLAKRPSVKRKKASGDEDEGSFQAAASLLSSTSHVLLQPVAVPPMPPFQPTR